MLGIKKFGGLRARAECVQFSIKDQSGALGPLAVWYCRHPFLGLGADEVVTVTACLKGGRIVWYLKCRQGSTHSLLNGILVKKNDKNWESHGKILN